MPSPRLSPKLARFFALQFTTAPIVLLLVLAFLLYNTRPNHMGTTGGIDPINTTIAWIAFVVVIGALSSVQLIFARQMRGEAKGVRRGVESW